MKNTNEVTKKVVNLYKSEDWFNPYFCGKFEVGKISFYDPAKKEVVFSVRWFGSNNRIPEFRTREILTRNKLNLDGNAFIITEGTDYFGRDKKKVVYLPITDYDFKMRMFCELSGYTVYTRLNVKSEEFGIDDNIYIAHTEDSKAKKQYDKLVENIKKAEQAKTDFILKTTKLN